MIGQHYVRTGVLTNEDGALLARLQNMRHTGDYDDFFDWTQEDVEPYIPKAEAKKTAVICSAVFPEFIWLDTGGMKTGQVLSTA